MSAPFNKTTEAGVSAPQPEAKHCLGHHKKKKASFAQDMKGPKGSKGNTPHNHESCQMKPAVASVHQTLDEMDFERGLWYAGTDLWH